MRRIPHCSENTIYVFLFSELRGLSSNFHIHVSGNGNQAFILDSHHAALHLQCGADRNWPSLVAEHKMKG
jgi:hypothetical protein